MFKAGEILVVDHLPENLSAVFWPLPDFEVGALCEVTAPAGTYSHHIHPVEGTSSYFVIDTAFSLFRVATPADIRHRALVALSHA